jgi:hypothetical protein
MDAWAHGGMPAPLDAVTEQIDSMLAAMDFKSLYVADSVRPIEQDIKVVAGGDMQTASEAMSRLVTRGSEAVPYIHQAILGDGLTNIARMLFSTILGVIAEPGSEKYIISAAEISLGEIDPDNSKESRELYTAVYALLSRFKDPEETIAYSNRLLDNSDAGIHAHATALRFLAKIKHKPSMRWVAQYRTASAHEIRYALMYLQSALGDVSVKPDVISILRTRPESEKRNDFRQEEYLLLLGLIEITTPEEIDAIMANVKNINSKISNLSKLYKGNEAQRAKAADTILNAWGEDIKSSLSALEYLIQINNAAPYVPQWKLRHPALMRMLEHLGYVITIEKDEARFIKLTKGQFPGYPSPEKLSKAVVESLFKNDIDMFISSSLFNGSDFSSLLFPDEDKSKQVAEYEKMKDRTTRNWRELYQKGLDAGMQWADLRYISSDYKILVSVGGLQSTAIIVTFGNNKDIYSMKLPSALLYDGVWHTLAGPKSGSLAQVKK